MIKNSIILNTSVFIFFYSCINANKEEKNTYPKYSNSTAYDQNDVSLSRSDTIKFNKLEDLISYFNKKTDSLDKLRVEAFRKLKSKPPSYRDSIQLIETAYYGLLGKRNEYIYKYLGKNEKNSENMVGIIYLVVDHKIPILLIDSMYKQFPLSLRNSPSGKLFFTKIEERKKAETTFEYDVSLLNLKFENLNGDQITLGEINSKLLLLDFWASWCAPCRYENRILVREKESMLDRTDISIIAISLDTDRNKWIKASREDSLNYLTVCDFKALESPLAKGLKIQTVPYNLLINKDGKILAHNLWGNELKEFLKSL